MSLHDDMDPTKAYIGIEKLWVLPADHPFNACAQWHDQQYDLAREGELIAPNSNNVDRIFNDCCLRVAGENFKLRLEAYLMYDLCQVWGKWRWPEASVKAASMICGEKEKI